MKEIKMQHEITYKYSPELVKTTTWQFFLADKKWPTVVLWGIMAIFGVFYSLSADYRWVGGFSVASVLIFVSQWVIYYQKAIKLAVELKDKSVVIKFTDENVAFELKDHTSIVNWSGFSKVWILKDVWLFFIYSDNNYTMVPSSCVVEEIGMFITKKLSENNVKIIKQQEKKE